LTPFSFCRAGLPGAFQLWVEYPSFIPASQLPALPTSDSEGFGFDSPEPAKHVDGMKMNRAILAFL
jgi:hypothetical protein